MSQLMLLLAAMLLGCSHLVQPADVPCVPRKYNYSSTVCVCNSTYCDEQPTPDPLPSGHAYLYTSSQDGARLLLSEIAFRHNIGIPKHVTRFYVDRFKTFQQMIGYGASMTDSAAINIKSLDEPTQKRLMGCYFGSGDSSARYNIVRVPMGGTDFSTRQYTYDDTANNEPDVDLEGFQLAPEDIDYKIPLLLQAMEMSDVPLKLHTSPWSAPDWMKGFNGTKCFSYLQKQYYAVWAKYFMKFLDEYEKCGVDFWAVSLQNEPSDGSVIAFCINSMGALPEDQREWMEEYLVPAMNRSGRLDSTTILVGEDSRNFISWAEKVLEGETARKYAWGASVHWYRDWSTDPAVLDRFLQKYPEKHLLYTEASNGPFLGTGNQAVKLGDWETCENYTTSNIQVANYNVSGWHEWNLALDPDGGPNWVNNVVDAAIIVNASAGEFLKQPMFYCISHFSKFVARGSYRVKLTEGHGSGQNKVEATAFVTPDCNVVVVMLNRQQSTQHVAVVDNDGGWLPVKMPAHSVQTLVYRCRDAHHNKSGARHRQHGRLRKM